MSETTNEPTLGAEGQATSAAVEPRFTQDDLNRAAATERRKAQKLAEEHESLKAKLASFEESQKSEAQKAIEAAARDARKAADAEWSSKLTAQAVDAELRLQLQAKGYDPDLAVLVKAKASISSADEVSDAIDNALAGKEWARKQDPAQAPEPRTPFQGGSPSGGTGRGGRWNEQTVMDFIAQNPRGITREIEAEMKRDMGW